MTISQNYDAIRKILNLSDRTKEGALSYKHLTPLGEATTIVLCRTTTDAQRILDYDATSLWTES